MSTTRTDWYLMRDHTKTEDLMGEGQKGWFEGREVRGDRERQTETQRRDGGGGGGEAGRERWEQKRNMFVVLHFQRHGSTAGSPVISVRNGNGVLCGYFPGNQEILSF